MLHPKNNRIDYGEQLVPPPGYQLAHAIGTTYSLDLEALMVLPVALFYSQTLDGNAKELRYDMLDAITKASDKITVYYQKGQLKAPKKYYHLMAYWEKGIEAISMSSHLNSFHPKIWIIRYEGEDLQPKYRLLITSRNLTYSRDWDVAFSTEGEVTETEHSKNTPLFDFLKYLNSQGKRKIPAAFISDLMKVKFEIPIGFENMSFCPIGVENIKLHRKYISPVITNRTWDELLIISPFVDNTTLNKFSRITTSNPYLLSRKEELDSIQEQVLDQFNSWQFSNFIQRAEYIQELEEIGVDPMNQNLHAKLFIGMFDKTPYWFIGSANCSDAAQERNVEFMVELKGKNTKTLHAKEIFKSLTYLDQNDTIPLFEKYNYQARLNVEEQKRLDLEIRKIRYDVSNLPMKGYPEPINEGSAYNLKIEIEAESLSLPEGFKVKVKPLPETQKSLSVLIPGKLNLITDFTGYIETLLSPFLVFEISKDGKDHTRFLIPMEIEMPESRLNKIFIAIIDSQEKFFKYLSFLLNGEDAEIIEMTGAERKGSSSSMETGYLSLTDAPVYEKLLIAASRYPDKLNSIDALINKLKEESHDFETPIITSEFESFWQIFSAFIENKK